MGFRIVMSNISIIGSGSWAEALTKILVNQKILIKCRKIKSIENKFNSNRFRLTSNFKDLANSNIIFLAVPSQTMRENLLKLKNVSHKNKPTFVVCSKGVEKKTNKLMSQVIKDFFPSSKVAILSGPNFSSELIKRKPSASVLASSNKMIMKEIAKYFSQDKFRIYFNDDIIGTQIGGTMKNIIAIACGYIHGCGLGENAKAAIITRGLSEIIDLGLKMGAKKETFYGLSGIGDLVLSCSSLKSRNAKFGYRLAKTGELPKNILLEGLESCDSICELGKKHKVELPICLSVKSIINGQKLEKIILNLLSRPIQFER